MAAPDAFMLSHSRPHWCMRDRGAAGNTGPGSETIVATVSFEVGGCWGVAGAAAGGAAVIAAGWLGALAVTGDWAGHLAGRTGGFGVVAWAIFALPPVSCARVSLGVARLRPMASASTTASDTLHVAQATAPVLLTLRSRGRDGFDFMSEELERRDMTPTCTSNEAIFCLAYTCDPPVGPTFYTIGPNWRL